MHVYRYWMVCSFLNGGMFFLKWCVILTRSHTGRSVVLIDWIAFVCRGDEDIARDEDIE